jgi:predicted metallo-beta-lactamase superfamily hydrolase
VSKKEVLGYKTRDNEFEKLREEFQKLMDNAKGDKIISFHFVRGTKHKFDFHNMVQIVADLLVAHNFIEDDDMDHFIPMPFKVKGEWYSYDKENPGVWIKIN